MDSSSSVAVSYDAGFIVLSYFISLVGCVTTLELLHRRTSIYGIYNWYLLLASCVTMGGIGIWCMHFIGNRAIILDGGDAAYQIVYSSAFTAVSFFLPILVLLVAFYILAVTGKANRILIIVSGVLTGTAVCGMHYVGQLGISNYSCSYQVGNVVGAAIIAVTASLVALSVFFRLREMWTDSWWKRALCGAILACAVSGMHWTATVGTIYHYRTDQSTSSGMSREETAIVCSVLSVAACLILLIIAFLRGRKIRITRTRAQQLVLACAYFDEEGRLMVTSEGFLPYQKITNRFVEKTFGEDELTQAHPTFLWVYKASRNWPAIKDLIPGMIDSLNSDPAASRYQPGHGSEVFPDDASAVSINFAAVFKQLFCVAAQNLSVNIHEPIEKLGVLFEEPLETGAVTISNQPLNGARKFSRMGKAADIERQSVSSYAFGRGKYLFVNRHLNKAEAAKFAAQGYRFGPLQQISEPLARNMKVTQEAMLLRLERMKIYVSPEHFPPPGVHLAAFVVRPAVQKSFDVVVPVKSQNQLPLVPLPFDTLTEWHLALISRFDEWDVKSILQTLVSETSSLDLENTLRWQLHSAFTQLIDLVGDSELMMQAKFSAKQIHIPCRPVPGRDGPDTCVMLTIRVMATIHYQTQQSKLTHVPLSFFGAQQQAEAGNQGSFARRVRMEFGYKNDNRASQRISTGEHSIHNSFRRSVANNSMTEVKLAGLEPSKLSPRFRISMNRLSIGARSDEANIVNDEKSMSEREDHEPHTPVATSFEGDSEKNNTAKDGDLELVVLGEEKTSWVSDLFGQFQF